ncbi:MAG: hypothetical protein H6822_01575 [Planctomycetaceae bacterium]|nr:hypothetical protein [Planctomycetales bacterium]MCB9920837.1 hypothetical protein [Planctomycetaceae bacterium]
MSKPTTCLLACGITLLLGCQPNRQVPLATPGSDSDRAESHGKLDTATRDANPQTASESELNDEVEDAAQSTSAVDVHEIIELEFTGDENFDMHLRRDGNPFPTEPILFAEEFQNRILEFKLIDAEDYERLTKDTGEARSVGAEFLRKSIAARHQRSVSEIEQAREIGKRAIASGSTDPLIRAELEAIKGRSLTLDDVATMTIAIEEMKDVGYRPVAQFLYYHNVFLFNIEERTLTLKHSGALRNHVVAMLRSHPPDEKYLRAAAVLLQLAMQVIQFAGLEETKRLVDACLAIKDLDPWLKYLLVGQYYVALGWEYRGMGVASEVTDEGWEQFGKYLTEAGKCYTRAWQLRPDFPEAATSLINVSMAGGDQRYTPRGWFDCAIRAQFDHQDAYWTLHGALQPRWSGDRTASPKFIREVLGSTQYNSQVPYWGLLLLERDVDNIRGRGSVIWQEAGNYDAVKKMIHGYLAYEDPAISTALLRSQLAAAASYTEDYVTANDAFQGLADDEIYHVIFGKLKLNPFEAKRLASVLSGPAAERLSELDWSRLKSDYLSVDELNVYATELAALRQLDPAEASQPYWDSLEQPISWRTKYLTGDWVNLTFAEGMPGWQIRGAEYKIESVDSVVVTSIPDSGPLQLGCGFAIDPPFTVELKVEDAEPDRFCPEVGVLFGDPAPANWEGKYLWIDPSQQLFGRERVMSRHEGEEYKLNKTTHILVHAWKDDYQRFLNGTLADCEYVKDLVPNGQLTFGLPHTAMPFQSVSIRFSNIRVRRLTIPGPNESTAIPQ